VAKLPGVTVREQVNVPEDDAAGDALETAASGAGASLVFATAFGHFDPPVLAAAQKHPTTTYLHCGGLYQEGKHPENAFAYYGYLDEAFYVAGVTAGLMTTTRKLGFVAAKGLPHVLRDLNAFALGARSINPKITTTVIFTRAWSAPGEETAAGNTLADAGADVLAMYVNAPGTLLELAERRGLFSVGVHVNGAKLAPKGYLTGAEWRWAHAYPAYVKSLREGHLGPHLQAGGLREGTVDVSPFGPSVPPPVRERAATVRAQLIEGTLVIFNGPLKDNAGQAILPAGEALLRNDVRLMTANFLVEGVVGTLPE
jgi:basic membrane protein A